MANKENQPPTTSAPTLSRISPTNKPSLSRQRDHSACRRPETPLRVRKTREQLRPNSVYADIPPPCVHLPSHPHDHHSHCATEDDSSDFVPSDPTHDMSTTIAPVSMVEAQAAMPPPTTVPPAASKFQRQKSVSRRMLSRVKQGIANRSKSSQSIRPAESETNMMHRLSGRRKHDFETERRSQSFDDARESSEVGRVVILDSIVAPSSSTQRSFTDSTVSTAEVLGEYLADEIAAPTSNRGEVSERRDLCPAAPPSLLALSPSLQHTPRPLCKAPTKGEDCFETRARITIPCVELRVTLEHTSVDVHTKRDIWIALETIVTLQTVDTAVHANELGRRGVDSGNGYSERTEMSALDNQGSHVAGPMIDMACGEITSLRLCFKPVDGCRVRDVVGRKAVKNVTLGQQCSLFVNLSIPRIRVRDSAVDLDQASLFTELESMVGTLETEILHVEARYRHSLLPLENVVTIRHVCKMKRPKTESRWSVSGPTEGLQDSNDIRLKLAQYLFGQYPFERALELTRHFVGPEETLDPGIRRLYSTIPQDSLQQGMNRDEETQPVVVVTDIDFGSMIPSTLPSAHYTSVLNNLPALKLTSLSPPTRQPTGRPTNPNALPSASLAPQLISAPKTTSALTSTHSLHHHPNPLDSTSSSSSAPDTAQQLWRHIRRTSLSAKQLEDLAPERLQVLEASDAVLRDLRRRALANKRSVGAETLRAWRWDEQAMGRRSGEGGMEAPWMV